MYRSNGALSWFVLLLAMSFLASCALDGLDGEGSSRSNALNSEITSGGGGGGGGDDGDSLGGLETPDNCREAFQQYEERQRQFDQRRTCRNMKMTCARTDRDDLPEVESCFEKASDAVEFCECSCRNRAYSEDYVEPNTFALPYKRRDPRGYCANQAREVADDWEAPERCSGGHASPFRGRTRSRGVALMKGLKRLVTILTGYTDFWCSRTAPAYVAYRAFHKCMKTLERQDVDIPDWDTAPKRGPEEFEEFCHTNRWAAPVEWSKKRGRWCSYSYDGSDFHTCVPWRQANNRCSGP